MGESYEVELHGNGRFRLASAIFLWPSFFSSHAVVPTMASRTTPRMRRRHERSRQIGGWPWRGRRMRGRPPSARDSGGASSMGPRRSAAPRAAAPPTRRPSAISSWGCAAPRDHGAGGASGERERGEGEGEMEVRGRRGRAALEEEEAQEEEGDRRRRAPVAPVAVVASG